ncbi:unnamed protein product [Closterium sp. Naga37s-1]|nr:unnamed protein product [Closterium sp. Naga37s-1]
MRSRCPSAGPGACPHTNPSPDFSCFFPCLPFRLCLQLCDHLLLTNALKVSIGRPRPHFFIVCFPSGVPVYGSDGNAQCNGSSSSVMESRVSFPSGHTSMSFAVSFSGLTYAALFLAAKLQASMSFSGLTYAALFLAAKLQAFSLTYAALFLAAKLQAFSTRGRGQLWRLVPSACCLAGAASVGITRVVDYWHFPFDVFVGGLIGKG